MEEPLLFPETGSTAALENTGCFLREQGIVTQQTRLCAPSPTEHVPALGLSQRSWQGCLLQALCQPNPSRERPPSVPRGRAGKEGRAQHQAGLGPLSPRVGRCGWRPRCPSSPPRQAPPPALAPAWQRRLCLLRLRLETCCQLLPRHRGARHSRSSRPAEGPGSVRAGASKGPAQLSGLPPHHSRMLSWPKRKGPVGPSSCSQVSHGQDLSPHGMAL